MLLYRMLKKNHQILIYSIKLVNSHAIINLLESRMMMIRVYHLEPWSVLQIYQSLRLVDRNDVRNLYWDVTD